ncbi:MAG: hypothetical protein KBS47_05475 [Bacteroidales bacterium]|nr:hypothetical protein [Candidatus Equimonas enterica]
MHKSYQKPRARLIRLSSGALLAASEFGSVIESFEYKSQYGSSQSTIEGCGENRWGSGGASREGFGEKTVGQ